MFIRSGRYALVLSFSFACCHAQGQSRDATPAPVNDLLHASPFIHIPGPNPILEPADKPAWDDDILETAGVFKDMGKYYLYYHASGNGEGYQIGVAVADHPLGPFKRYEKNPILGRGEEGTWEDVHIAHALVIKEGTDKYYLWYCARGTSRPERGVGLNAWDIGLATADNPLGPWRKHPDNPVVEDFGYVCAVVKVEKKYYMYSAWPIGKYAPDYSPISVAVADKPTGPWKKYEGNPILEAGEAGEWDDTGTSDASIVYSSGMFHMFYAGAKVQDPRILSRESLGYAYSTDGFNFRKYGRNPIASRDTDPNLACFAEPRALIEMPFIYVYHTARYKEPWRAKHKDIFPRVEDLGVQVLVTQRPFKLDMPVVNLDSLAAGASHPQDIVDSPSVALDAADSAAITVECRYDAAAAQGLRIHVRSSHDGRHYDTSDLQTFDLPVSPGELCRKTFPLESDVRFVKFIIENLDDAQSIADVKLTATLGGD